MSADLPLTICWFDTAMPTGRPALGDVEHTTWSAFTDVFRWRREGPKDGPNFVPSTFKLEPGGRHVRRLKANLLCRTAIALDLETNKKIGAVLTVTPDEAALRAQALGFACVVYTSHNHRRLGAVFRRRWRVEQCADRIGALPDGQGARSSGDRLLCAHCHSPVVHACPGGCTSASSRDSGRNRRTAAAAFLRTPSAAQRPHSAKHVPTRLSSRCAAVTRHTVKSVLPGGIGSGHAPHSIGAPGAAACMCWSVVANARARRAASGFPASMEITPAASVSISRRPASSS